MRFLIILTIGLFLTGCVNKEPVAGLGAECLPCDCKITAEKVIKDNPTIEIPDEAIKFKYQGIEFTKEDLDAAKKLIERK